ncbi:MULTISPECIES: prolipoprotein diacylglyceryl transferase [Thermaceae]|jgi:phosphatidylglycerol:prolipoprotein diacylglycerol transferase|uniref:Phosphatidylglycerol--prolipoprotein diacylglyceryl transferase n=4 Tax=Meiothermus TaxID=65551 RepID=A0A399E5Q1_9DEIN|nr:MULTISPECIES: prolipoprotein diacylglyceryl transferase [Thermaceae]AWR88166.1 prolipoprotein diacylglyceryl transferase [Meiothermus taiwanensis WR-220]KIQ53447.1 diacylglyceryl transferase [Meiothermus taiwanensis]KZK15331.1 prolipoprotein diacylglyceryl transferase [Meiothermus taiwanensis]RIH77272.1 Prolipoprotein diacylglyceryl transferase [Meiothermus taiwanensis]RIH80372.1 Prolipoprotein diacylglyceryl transferase [Meiothermus hypogaeus]
MDTAGIKLGPLFISWHGLLIVLAILVGVEVAKRLLRRWGHDPANFERTAFWAVLWGVVGARVAYVITNPDAFLASPWSVLEVWRGGLSFHGGMAGGLLAFWYYHRRHGLPFYPYLEAALPGVALGIIGGRIGNFLSAWDSAGRLTTLPIGYTFPQGSGFPGVCTSTFDLAYGACAGPVVMGPLHLTQIYGAVIGLALLVATGFWLRPGRPFGYAFWQFVLWYSLLRSVLEEPFRLNPLWLSAYQNNQLGIGFFTATQLFSVPLILLAIWMLRRLKRKPPEGTRVTAWVTSRG